MSPLPDAAPVAQPAPPLSRSRQRRADGLLLRRRDGVQGRRRNDERRRQASTRIPAGAQRVAAPSGGVLLDLSQLSSEPAPRLRDDAHALAPRARPDRDRLRMAFSSRRNLE